MNKEGSALSLSHPIYILAPLKPHFIANSYENRSFYQTVYILRASSPNIVGDSPLHGEIQLSPLFVYIFDSSMVIHGESEYPF